MIMIILTEMGYGYGYMQAKEAGYVYNAVVVSRMSSLHQGWMMF